MSDPTRPLPAAVPSDGTRTPEPTTAVSGPDAARTTQASGPPTVPGYELLDVIGRGGMGVVYRARDLALDRDVAVKLLSDRDAPGSSSAIRFLDEARITAKLQHPGVPAVHQAGTLPDGRPFLAMKLIKGRTLDALLADRPDPGHDRGRFVAAFEKVCEAVAYAHSRGVIHRDLKPANVMVGAFGEVQVMDWGLAKVLGARPAAEGDPEETAAGTLVVGLRDPDGSFTQAGSVLGTPAYISPEQALGEVAKVDARSDVFGLGAVLAVVLTGHPPFPAASVESTRLRAATGDVAECFARLDACGADPELVALCKRCLSPKRDDRPADAGEVARAVAELRNAADERARQAERDKLAAEVQAAEQRKRRRVQLALAVSAAALLAVSGGGLWWAELQRAGRRAEESRARQAVDAGLDLAAAAIGKDNPVYGEIDAALTQVEQRLTTAGADDARARFDQLTADRQMLTRLDEIDDRRWTLSADKQRIDKDYALAQYPVVFRQYGLDPDAGSPGALAERVRRSLIAARLMAALENWLEVGGGAAVLALVNAIDPDPDRVALRADYARRDRPAVAARVARLDGAALPPAFAQFVGGHPLTPQDQAIRVLTAAQAAHPDHFGLAVSTARRLTDAQPRERAEYYRIALALRPANTVCYLNLGVALADLKDFDAAVAAHRTAIRLDPTFPRAYLAFAYTLRAKGDRDGAIACCRKVIELEPTNLLAHTWLAMDLAARGDRDEAIKAYREVVRLDPTYAAAFNNLGLLLNAERDRDGAVAAYREAVRLRVEQPKAYTTLAGLLYQRGEPAAALQVLRDGAAHRPAWMADPRTEFRYDAACTAALAGTGQGKDAPPESGRPALRTEARDWLLADLAVWRKWAGEPGNKPAVRRTLTHWLDDADFAAVRDPKGLDALPADERRAWSALWADVRELLAAVTPPTAPPPRPVK
jgi:serine/threonine protein kinase/Flp pilus assembly protein TadD